MSAQRAFFCKTKDSFGGCTLYTVQVVGGGANKVLRVKIATEPAGLVITGAALENSSSKNSGTFLLQPIKTKVTVNCEISELLTNFRFYQHILSLMTNNDPPPPHTSISMRGKMPYLS